MLEEGLLSGGQEEGKTESSQASTLRRHRTHAQRRMAEEAEEAVIIHKSQVEGNLVDN